MNICTDIEVIWYNDLHCVINFNNIKTEICIYLNLIKIIYWHNDKLKKTSQYNNINELLNMCKLVLKGYDNIYYDIEKKVFTYFI